MIGNEATELIPLLWQGGNYGYYFTLPKRATHWREVTNPDSVPTDDTYVYFGVHPTMQEVKGRACVKDIACINCLFAEFDSKDFGSKKATLERVVNAPFKPSIIIISGGGYHVYWLLKNTFFIKTEEDRERAKYIQCEWVELLDADPSSKDLARILRPPGTKNHKYDPPRDVEFYEFNPDIRYDLGLLEAILPDPPPREIKSLVHHTPAIQKVQDALDRLSPWRCDEYHSWIKTGMALQELGTDGLSLWDTWSQGSDKYESGDCKKRWETFKGNGMTLGSIFYWADHDNLSSKNKSNAGSIESIRTVEEPPHPEPPPLFEDEPIADKLSPLVQRRWTVADLLEAEFPEPRWAIPGIIPEGLSIFGGRPKVGKSWMMLQAAWSVGTGGRFFNQEVECGDVLYLALEDGPRRLQERIKAMGIGSDALITFVNRWPPLHQTGMNDLLIELEREVYRLLVIDTLTRSLPGIDQKKDGGAIGKVFDELQRLATTRNTAIVLIDHTRKPSGYAADPVDDILHATEKTAIADCILALYKQQGKPGATLLGRGRDIEDIEYSMQFDRITRCWQVESISTTEKYSETLDALEELGKVQVGDIANMTGKNKGNVYKELMVLIDEGMVRRDTIGRNVFYEVINNG